MEIVWNSIKANKKNFIFYFALGITNSACGYTTPLILAAVVPFTYEKMVRCSILLIFAFVLSGGLQYLYRKFVISRINIMAGELCSEYFEKTAETPAKKLSSEHTGTIIAGMGQVTGNFTNMLTSGISEITNLIVGFAVILPAIFKQSTRIGIVYLIIILTFLCISYHLSGKHQARVKELGEKGGRLWQTVTDNVMNILTVLRLQVQDYAKLRLKHVLGEYTEENIKYYSSFSRMFLMLDMLLLLTLCMAIVTTILQAQTVDNNTTNSYFIFYVSMFLPLKGTLMSLTFSILNVMVTRTHVIKMDEIIDTGEMEPNHNMVYEWTSFGLAGAKVSYPESSKEFSYPEFLVKKGQKVSISGESGQGKTTLLNLILGELTPSEGHFLINGRPSKDRPSIAYMSQEAELFQDTLRANLCLGKEIPEEKLLELLKDAGLEEWLHDLKKGLDTQLGERGQKVSSGQKERINFIRCILLNRDVYLLDEVTAHLDPVSERKIIQMTEKYLSGKTIILVSHRKRIARICDVHYLLEGNTLAKVC